MAQQKRVGVLLAGCGFLDGAEIHEATCTLLSLDRRGAKAVERVRPGKTLRSPARDSEPLILRRNRDSADS